MNRGEGGFLYYCLGHVLVNENPGHNSKKGARSVTCSSTRFDIRGESVKKGGYKKEGKLPFGLRKKGHFLGSKGPVF